MTDRVYLMCDESDDCDTAVRVYEIPAVVADSKELLDAIGEVVHGQMFAIVKEYRPIGNILKTPHPIEEILDKDLIWRKKYIQNHAERLRQYNIRIDRKEQTLTYTCAEGNQYWVQSILEQFLKSVKKYKQLKRLRMFF